MTSAGSTFALVDGGAGDDSLALLRTGYAYPLGKRARLGADGFTTMLMGHRATVVSGPAGVQLFYDESKVQRHEAIPRPLAHTLFGAGAVHGLDDAAHRHRKQLFLGLLTVDASREIADRARTEWRTRLGALRPGDRLAVFDAAVRVHTRTVCGWAGVPTERVDDALAADLIAIVDGFGGVGVRHLRARLARARINRWSARLIEDVRSSAVTAPAGSALATVAAFRDADGAELPARTAGVELVNMVRPTVAVSYFAAFAVDALREHGDRQAFAAGDDALLESFAHEVRRFYPFVPVLGAKVRTDFDWQGTRFRAGSLVVLDVYGTLHDPKWWAQADAFDALRFRSVAPDYDAFVPQGGGDVASGHRCPGERTCIELVKAATEVFSASNYELPAQDLTIALSRMPTRPHDGVVVRLRSDAR